MIAFYRLTASRAVFFLYFTLFGLVSSYAQPLIAWELSPQTGDQVSNTSTANAANILPGLLNRGAGLTVAVAGGSMSSSGWIGTTNAVTTLVNAVANNDYYQFTMPVGACASANITAVNIILRASNFGPNTVTLRSSLDGYSADLGTATVGVTSVLKVFPVSLMNVTGTVTFRLYGYGSSANGTGAAIQNTGTMRIGTSMVALDNDIFVSGTTALGPIGSAIIDGDGAICGQGNISTIPVSVNIAGGTGPYTLVYTDGSTNTTVPNYISGTPLSAAILTSTTYNLVSVTDANGCNIGSLSGDAIVQVSPDNIEVLGLVLDPTCAAPLSGSITTSVSGGLPLFTYLWTNGATTSNITGLAGGTYTVIVTDLAGCNSTESFIVASPTNCPAACPILSTAVTNTECNQSIGSVSVIVSPPSNTVFSYMWSNGATTQNITGLSAGTYTVTVTGSTCPAPGVSISAVVGIAPDLLPPSITCPPEITVSCAAEVPIVDITLPTATDNCNPPAPIVTHLSDMMINQTCPHRFFVIRKYVAIDGAGLRDTCTQLITVFDNIAPVLAAGNILPCYPTLAAAESAAINATSASDNCQGVVNLTASTIGTCTATITVTGTDACGVSSFVVYNTTIDNVPPTLVTGQIATCYTSETAAQAAAIAATTISDNCTGAITVTSAVSGTCNATVTVTAIDACGNTGSVVYNTRIDVLPPTFNESPLPAPLVISCEDPLPMAPMLTGSDNCGGGTVPTVLWINELHYDNTGADLNEAVEIAGTAGLMLNDYRIILYNGNGGVVYNTLILSGTIDNEGSGFGAVAFTYPSNGIQNGAPDGVALYQVSTNMVIQFISYEGVFQANDGPASGMFSTDIGVLETGTEAAGLSLQLTGMGSSAAQFTWVGPIANSINTLNANQVITSLPVSIPATFMQTEVPGACAGSRIITRSWKLTDACGLMTVHNQTITLNDAEAPTLTPTPPNVTLSCSTPIPLPPAVIATDDCDPSGIITGAVWINEIHYDNVGATDVNEFIEVAGLAGVNLASYELYLYNGNGGGNYDVIPLSGIIPNQNNGFGALSFPAPGLQNGAPDGIALFGNGTVIQFLSYEGVFTAVGGPANGLLSTDIGVFESNTTQIGQSVQLSGTGTVYNNFVWNAPATATPGTINTNQTFPVQPPVGLLVSFNEVIVQSPTCPANRTVTRTWSATDGCGNVSAHTQIITIQDILPPALNCQPLSVSLSILGTATVTLNDITFTAVEDCSNPVVVTPVSQTYTCAQEGTVQNITITATDACNNIGTCSVPVTILPAPRCTPVIEISKSCQCLNNATILLNGQFADSLKITSLSGKVWTVTSVSGLYTGTSAQPPVAPTLIPLGTTFTEFPAGSGDYYLYGKHVDALPYSITVTSATGEVLTIGNSCEYPNPVISGFTAPVCLFTPAVTLSGDLGDAFPAPNTGTFTVNGAPATVFDPMVLGIGTHIITFTVDGGVPKENSFDDPGCIQSVTKIVQIVETPSTLACHGNLNLSLEGIVGTGALAATESCVAIVTPDMILSGSYACFDDYEVILTLANGYVIPDDKLTPAYIGQKINATVRHKVSGVECWGCINLEDKLPPIMQCRDLIISCAQTDVSPSAIEALQLPGAFPVVVDCSLYTLTYNDEYFDLDCGDLVNGFSNMSAYIIRTWDAIDVFGNRATCSQFIYLERIPLLQINFPADVTLACDAISAGPNASTGVPTALVNDVLYNVYPSAAVCDLGVVFRDDTIVVCEGTTKILRTWTAVDWCQPLSVGTNPREMVQVIKLLDDAGPVLVCPVNLTVGTNQFDCLSDYQLPSIIASDNCSRISSATALWQIDSVFFESQAAITNFPGNNLWNTDTLVVFGIANNLPLGNTRIEYTVTDDCGNTSSCRFRVQVRDDVPPVVVCNQHVVVSVGYDDPNDCYLPNTDDCTFAGVTWVKANSFDNGSYDNCGGNLQFTVRRMAPSSAFINSLNSVNGAPDCFDPIPDFPSEFQRATIEYDSLKIYCDEVGTSQMVIVRAYQLDADGQITDVFNECMVEIEVQDKIRPLCTSPANVTVSCENFDPTLWAYGTASTYDNCCLDTTKAYNGVKGITHSANFSQFDTVCNRGVITRTFRAYDCADLTSQCTQRITVQYNQDYFVHFPGDRIINDCDTSGNYGSPVIFDEDCELVGSSFHDEIITVVPDACFKIIRTWRISNWCTFNPDIACVQVPNPNPNAIVNHPSNLNAPFLKVTPFSAGNLSVPVDLRSTLVSILPGQPQTDYSIFYDPNANCYEYSQVIKVIDNVAPIITNCPTAATNFSDITSNDGNLWTDPFFNDPIHNIHDLCEMPVDLNIVASDMCSGTNVKAHYLLFLDTDNSGDMETVINSLTPPPYGIINVGNSANQNYTGGNPLQFDKRAVPANQVWRFGMQEVVANGKRTSRVGFNTLAAPNTYVLPQLPHGRHKIKWFVTDGCGNETSCEYIFEIKDGKAPTVVCLNGISVNIMPTGMIEIWDTELLQYTTDNCTPDAQLKTAICKTCTSFPLDAQGNPVKSVIFTCSELGTRTVRIWSIDASGNADYCETYVLVQDNNTNCGPSSTTGTIAGDLKGKDKFGVDQGLDQGEVLVNGSHPAIPTGFNTVAISNIDGHYSLNNAVPIGADFTITPVKDDNHLNGVDMLDVLKIQRHILGQEPLSSPYRIIAADVNNSGGITSNDIIELRKLILGAYTELPNIGSYRFVDGAYIFPNPNNPFVPKFPEIITVAQLQNNYMAGDFEVMKVGDVTGNAVFNINMAADDRTNGASYLDLKDQVLVSGQIYTVEFFTTQAVLGYQFTLEAHGLEMLEVMPGTGLEQGNFHIFGQRGIMTACIEGVQLPRFSVKFKALTSGSLSQMLKVGSSITKAKAYSLDHEQLDIALRFDGQQPTVKSEFTLYQNAPNPFVEKTAISFYLPEAAIATLTVTDELGRALFIQKGNYAKGMNTITLNKQVVKASGVLFYTVSTDLFTETKQMIITK
jgi:hypothetical protein